MTKDTVFMILKQNVDLLIVINITEHWNDHVSKLEVAHG